jgi:hypothetical protein
MQKFYRTTLIFILALFIGNIALAQDFPPDELFDKISTIKKMKLLEILKLNEDQTDKFIAKYSYWENKIKASRDSIRHKAEQLEDALKDKNDDATIAKLSQELLDMQQRHFKEMGEFHQAMQAVLDDRQYAKFLVFEIKFPQELKRLLNRRQGRGMGGKGRGPR